MAKRPVGRPKKSAAELAADGKIKAKIIEAVSDGKTLSQCCRDFKIGRSTVYMWLEGDGEFAGRFARAREVGFDAIADEAMHIVDDKTTDADAASRRIRADVRLRLLAKWDPRRYGDSVQLKHADADGDKLDMGPTAVAIRAASLLKTALERDDGSD